MSPAGIDVVGEVQSDFGASVATRPDRPPIIGFVDDAVTETALRDGLADVLPEAIDSRRGGIKAAIAAMQKSATPLVLIVDLSSESEPLDALGKLSEVVEPDVRVLVIGRSSDVDFYREVTRGMGAQEYLSKPITRAMVTRHFGPLVLGQTPAAAEAQGGRIVSVVGAHGGAGASVIAASLAWHLGVVRRRHTVLLDADLHRGVGALLLNTPPGTGLRLALEAPERVDALLAERAAHPAAERLHVLSCQEDLDLQPQVAPEAAAVLLDALRRRYNFIVGDVPLAPIPLYRDLLRLCHQRIVVMLPNLVSIRDTLRLLALAPGLRQTQRGAVVLNRVGMPGGLSRRQVEDALGMKVDVQIPDLPKQVAAAGTMGDPSVAMKSGFRTGIVELARQVAGSGLIDGTGTDDAPDRVNAGWKISTWFR